MVYHALLLTPSAGRGGGIERYADTVEWAFGATGVTCHRLDLRRSGAIGHLRMLLDAQGYLKKQTSSIRLVVAHRALLPVACVMARERSVDGISVVLHGSDVWGSRGLLRNGAECLIMRRPDVRMIAVSSFTAGAVWRTGPANVLPPGLSRTWFDILVSASAAVGTFRAGEAGVHVITAFRLSRWQEKGLPELMRAVGALRRSDIHVTVCGSGVVPEDLQRFVELHPGCTVRASLTDLELARELAAADLFVLATRTRRARHASGEGFGLVLLEAQVAGTPVVGPAYGGSHDAYIDGLTGATPADETAEALARTLDELIGDPWRLEQLGKQAAAWAQASFAPDLYASRAAARLL